MKIKEAEEARRFAEEKVEEARRLEEELLEAQRKVSEISTLEKEEKERMVRLKL